MNQDRIRQLIQFTREDPDEPFNFYALAIEYTKQEPDKSIKIYRKLLKKFPDYVPTYYQYASLLELRGEKEKALQIFREGIQKAKATNDTLALRELQTACNNLTFDE